MKTREILQKASEAAASLQMISDLTVSQVLCEVAASLRDATETILAANRQDLSRMCPDNPKYDRLKLTPERINSIASDMENVAGLPSPLGEVISETVRPNGMKITKISVPFGVVGVIYEARPNVTADVFSLCFRSGNVCVLKGGSDADDSSRAIVSAIHEVLMKHGIDPAVCTLLPADREATAELLGADTIVIHSGSAAKISREEAMKLSKDTLFHVAEAVGDTPIRLGIETMGKINQLGTLEEVIEQCRVSPIYAPVVDFGHLNARNIGGAFPDVDSYRRVFDLIATSLGDEYAKHLHCHFSKIEYTNAGEKKHLTFEDTVYGPDFEPLAEAIVREGVCPRIICESAGTMAEDALSMKQMWLSAAEARQ